MAWQKKEKRVPIRKNSSLTLTPELNCNKELAELVASNREHIKNIIAGRIGAVPSETLKDFGLTLHRILTEADDLAFDDEADRTTPEFKAAIVLKKTLRGTNQKQYESFEEFHESLDVFGHWRNVEAALKKFEATKKAEHPVVGREKDGRIVYFDHHGNTCRTGPIGGKTALQNAIGIATKRREEHEGNIEDFVTLFFGKVLKK